MEDNTKPETPRDESGGDVGASRGTVPLQPNPFFLPQIMPGDGSGDGGGGGGGGQASQDRPNSRGEFRGTGTVPVQLSPYLFHPEIMQSPATFVNQHPAHIMSPWIGAMAQGYYPPAAHQYPMPPFKTYSSHQAFTAPLPNPEHSRFLIYGGPQAVAAMPHFQAPTPPPAPIRCVSDHRNNSQQAHTAVPGREGTALPLHIPHRHTPSPASIEFQSNFQRPPALEPRGPPRMERPSTPAAATGPGPAQAQALLPAPTIVPARAALPEMPAEASPDSPRPGLLALARTPYYPTVDPSLDGTETNRRLRQMILVVARSAEVDPDQASDLEDGEDEDDGDEKAGDQSSNKKRKKTPKKARPRRKPESNINLSPPPAWLPISADLSPRERLRREEKNREVADIRKRRAREQNRLAAQKCRDRRVAQVEGLQQGIRDLEVSNSYWQVRAISLGADINDWNNIPEHIRLEMTAPLHKD